MAEPMDITPADNPLKRASPDEESVHSVEKSESLPTPPLTASPANQNNANRENSPAPSISTLSSITSTNHDRPADSSSAPPKKRRKLTVTEKEEQRKAKEERDRERAETKQKRDEEKRRKNEEKEAKQREKDLKKAKEEDEKKKREDEKKKKERAQPKIASFFKFPQQPTTPAKVKLAPSEPEGIPSLPLPGPAPSPEPQKSPERSSYKKTFLPFELKPHTTCAPHVLPRSQVELEKSQHDMERMLERASQHPQPSMPAPSLSTFFSEDRNRSRGLWQPSAREVIESLQGSSQVPVDLTDESGEHYRPTDLLGSLTIRHLHFSEDVRPPYFGSYTRQISPRKSSKLRKNPFSKLREDTNYDYDSEAEWEEPEEGEDIQSEGEDDEESVGSADEMDGFLDDEDTLDNKRRLITGDLKPVSTGLCWENPNGTINTSAQDSTLDLDSMKIEFFLALPKQSINPFSTVYWQSEKSTAAPSLTGKTSSTLSLSDNGKMKPPRNPLQPRSTPNDTMTIIGASSGMKGPIMGVASGKAAKTAAKSLQGPELLEFKDAVEGSNLTKIELQKALKKRFPKHTNDTIKATLSSSFARVGQHEADKVWKAIGT